MDEEGGEETEAGDARPSPYEDVIGDKDVASVVLSYLTSSGFDRAAAAFRR